MRDRNRFAFAIAAALAFLAGAPPCAPATHTGIDSMVVGGGLDFSAPEHPFPYYAEQQDDIGLNQIQWAEGGWAPPATLQASSGIRDLGAVSFEGLEQVPPDLAPGPGSVALDPATGRVLFWFAHLEEHHVYVVWTREGHLAKVIVDDIVSWADTGSPLQWDSFVAWVVVRWAYQDDGGRSFGTATSVGTTSLGALKVLR